MFLELTLTKGLPPFLRYDTCSTCVKDHAINHDENCDCCEIMEGWEEDIYTLCCDHVPKPCPIIVQDCAQNNTDPYKLGYFTVKFLPKTSKKRNNMANG